MYIPKYFSLSELTHSYTAIKYGIRNIPSFTAVSNLLNLCSLILDPARIELGSPITVTSGYRCIDLNIKVNGVSNSQHLTGCAVDLQCYDNKRLFNILSKNPNIDQLLHEYNGKSDWIHVSIPQMGCKPRRHIVSYYKV